MAKIVVNVKVNLKLKGGAGILALLLGVWVHHAQPYTSDSIFWLLLDRHLY